ncbi:hypothetical protein D6C95_07865, partial [Aureobasidium pullulans]
MRPPRRLKYCGGLTVGLTTVIFLLKSSTDSGVSSGQWYRSHHFEQDTLSLSIGTVVAAQSSDDTEWLSTLLPAWNHTIYLTDQPRNMSSTFAGKGHEASVYLDHVIEEYDFLPDIVIFLHAKRYQWHNDDPLYDNARVLSRLQLDYVQRQGYVNLRCSWRPGCPSEIKPLKDALGPLSNEYGIRTAPLYARAFKQLFPELEVPADVGVPCCAQFAVTKARIQQRSKDNYKTLRQWLLDTDLGDNITGRLFEYMWHIMLGEKATICPTAKDCYCRTYGLCNLACHES